MPTIQENFMADICEHPDDDTPRLIFADWLEEHGTTDAERERAEFIRLQCGHGTTDTPENIAKIERRIQGLQRLYDRKWTKDLPQNRHLHYFFARGFVHAVHGTAGLIQSHMDRLFSCAPIDHVTISNPYFGHDYEENEEYQHQAHRPTDWLLSSPHLKQVELLMVAGYENLHLNILAKRADDLRKLTRLSIEACLLNAQQHLRDLISIGIPFPALVELDLANNTIGVGNTSLEVNGVQVDTLALEQQAIEEFAERFRHIFPKVNIVEMHGNPLTDEQQQLLRQHVPGISFED